MATSQDIIPQTLNSWSSSNMRIVKFSHVWTINHFSMCSEQSGENIKSSTFSACDNDKNAWFLEVYPNGDGEDNKDYLSVFLNLGTSSKTAERVMFALSILNEKREKTKAKVCQTVHVFQPGEDWGFSKFVRRDMILDKSKCLLPDDSLLIWCEIQKYGERVNVSGKINKRKCQLRNDFGELFETQQFTDVTLRASDREFAAHKAILAARSPVFAAMFTHEMAEQASNRVEIADINPEVLTEMLRYIYTGKAAKLEELAGNLLSATDKYCLAGLKELCEETLYNNLSTENVVDTLILADLHQADQLKAVAINFISLHAATVFQTAGWATLTTSHPHLAIEALLHLGTPPTPKIKPSLPANQ